MLEPEGRKPLLDALRPPPGFTLDRAIGTTYSLNLMALLTAPLAFALYDRASQSGDSLDIDPIALLDAVRRHADRIDIFCQAGQIAPMGEYRPIVAYLEDSIHPVLPPRESAIFHPKVWLIRYRAIDGGQPRYRLLCMSRNLTFDRSWDTILVLEGQRGPGDGNGEGLESFFAALPRLATRPVAQDRDAAVRALAAEAAKVAWEAPAGFRDLRFWPLGYDGDKRWPFEGRADRMLIISPFLTAALLQRLPGRQSSSILVSRPESLDRLGAGAVRGFSEVLTIKDDAISREDAEDPSRASVEALGEAAGSELDGLHAKLYVADAGWRARVWTGSANATDAAYGGNVEFLTELNGPKGSFGIDATLAETPGSPTLRSILESYEAPTEEPQPASLEEQLDEELDVLRRSLGGLDFVANLDALGDDAFEVTLVGNPARKEIELPDPGAASCRPLTVRAVSSSLGLKPGAIEARFPALSFESMTSFFVVTLRRERDRVVREVEFVVNATLVGAPEDRRQRLLAILLRSREDLLRFLLMLLSDSGLDMALTAGAGASVTWQMGAAGWQALFEPMVRAFARDPSRIDEIASLVNELRRTREGQETLPERWAEVWDPIWAARQEVRK